VAARRHPAEARLRQVVRGSQRFVPCGEDRVGEEFRVVRIDRLRILWISPALVAVTVTIPPPADASTVSFASS
jgi:hypothetical protein